MFLNIKENKKSISSYSKQQGLGLPMALFIITIMSLIAAAVNRLGEVGSQSYTQNLLSVRAFYAAESGAQLRAQAVLSANPCTCGAAETVTYYFTAEGLNQCSATTSCTRFVANSETFCTLVSIGRCDNANAERTVEVRLK
jgi:MSHA biogenesis protein MshP